MEACQAVEQNWLTNFIKKVFAAHNLSSEPVSLVLTSDPRALVAL